MTARSANRDRFAQACAVAGWHRHVAPLAGPEAFILLPSDHDQWSVTVGRR